MIISILKIIFAILFSGFMGFLELFVIPFGGKGIVFHSIAKAHARTVLAVCGVKVMVEGLERVDFSQTHIYVSNHASMFDIPAVIAGIPDQIRIVYKKEIEKMPFFGWGLKFGPYIGIDRGNSIDAVRSIEEAARQIRKGASVLLFAEGTRTSDGKLQPFKRGAFNLALKAGIPVIPLTINGSYKVLPRSSWRITPGTITLVLEKPIVPAAADGKASEMRLRDEVHRMIEQHYTNQ